MAIKPWDSSIVDHSFMGLGGLYNAIIAANMEVCRRFGAENAHSIIGSALFAEKDATVDSIAIEIHSNTGIWVKEGDLEFLGRFVRASQAISEATKILKEGLK